MSKEQYFLAKALIQQNGDLVRFSRGADIGLIEKAEKALDLKFPPLYRLFLQDFGALVFAGITIDGITDDNFVTSSAPNGIWLTLEERKKGNIPSHLVLFFFLDDGEYAALDTRFSYEPDQCPVIVC